MFQHHKNASKHVFSNECHPVCRAVTVNDMLSRKQSSITRRSQATGVGPVTECSYTIAVVHMCYKTMSVL
jgi:hypothetical protein